MNAQVRIRLGNLFDGPSDLIVLPCNTRGGVTQFVVNSLNDHDLPWPGAMPLGSVEIMPLAGAENIAQYVAFAASVQDGITTPISALEQIGGELGRFAAKESAVREIAAPLLGAGAGGLQSEKVVQGLRRGFVCTGPGEATLTVHILHRPVYDRIRRDSEGHSKTNQLEDAETNRRRAFFSYTDSEGNGQWVVTVATYLRDNGIDARIDKWHLRHGMELPQWMCNELELADKVVIVSDEAYARKADGHVGGVGWETRVIQGDMLSLPVQSTKYIVIVRGGDFEKSVPKYLKAKYSIHWPTAAEDSRKRRELMTAIHEIYDAPKIEEVTVL